MKTIWKYKLEITDYQMISLPINAKIISTGIDPIGDLCIWAEVDSDQKNLLGVNVAIIGTGNPFPHGVGDEYKFLGSVLYRETLMWHVYVDSIIVKLYSRR